MPAVPVFPPLGTPPLPPTVPPGPSEDEVEEPPQACKPKPAAKAAVSADKDVNVRIATP
jgi:hypothetical protein